MFMVELIGKQVKMKVLVLVCVAVAVVLGQDPHNLKQEHEKCQSDPALRLSDAFLEEFRNNPETTNYPANLNAHLICLSTGLNLIDQEGRVNREGVRWHIKHDVQDKDREEALLNECAVNKATTAETVITLWKCLIKNDILKHDDPDFHT